MSHSRFRFLCRWWYHDQIGRNHDCRWSDRLNDKHDHFLRRDHLSGCRTQKGNTLHKEKNHTSPFSMSFCCCRCYCWYCCCVIFDSLCDRSPNGRGGVERGGKSVKGKRERSRMIFTSTEPRDQVFRLLFSCSSLHLLKNKKFHARFTHKSHWTRTNGLLQVCSLP